jgi:hypothetical protein
MRQAQQNYIIFAFEIFIFNFSTKLIFLDSDLNDYIFFISDPDRIPDTQ